MKNTCRKCGKGLVVPSWKTCNECDTVVKEPKKKPIENRYKEKYEIQDDDSLEYLARKHPAHKSKKQ